jgi:restriction system protein
MSGAYKAQRTSETELYLPILNALERMGGRAHLDDVLAQVEEDIASDLSEWDRQAVPTRPTEQRWRNTARWARKHLVIKGLLKRGSPKGIWELSDEGRRFVMESGRR